jgi:DNA methylase
VNASDPLFPLPEPVRGESDRNERRTRLHDQRVRAEEAARSALANDPSAFQVEVADVRDWDPPSGSIAAVISDPPYLGGNHARHYRDLADFAVRILPRGGALVAMTSVGIMAEVLAAMARPELVYRGTIAWLFDKRSRTQYWPRRCFQAWKPVLVLHKERYEAAQWYSERIVSEGTLQTHHRWEQNVDGFAKLVRWFTEPGETVASPFCGSGTEGVAALATGRRWVGCDVDPEAVATARERVRTTDYTAPGIVR